MRTEAQLHGGSYCQRHGRLPEGGALAGFHSGVWQTLLRRFRYSSLLRAHRCSLCRVSIELTGCVFVLSSYDTGLMVW